MTVTQALLRHVSDVMHKKGWTRDVLPQVFDHLAVVIGASKLEHLVLYARSLQLDKPTQYITATMRNEVSAEQQSVICASAETNYELAAVGRGTK